MSKTIIIIDAHYFDVTTYLDQHPGGKGVLQKFHLKDATDAFNSVKGHSDEYALDLLTQFCLGRVDEVDLGTTEAMKPP